MDNVQTTTTEEQITAARAKPRAAAKPARATQAAAPALARPLSGEEMLQLVKLAKGSSSIELKLSVPLAAQRSTIESIGLDPVETEPRMAFFFDTPDLALNQAGVVVRARRLPGGDADTVIKLRPVDPTTIDADLRRSGAFKVEVDVMPGGFVCSASFRGVCSGQEVLDVGSGALPLRKIFSKEQRAFYDEHAPAGVTMDRLVVIGPTFLLRGRHQPKDFDRPLTTELWLYPDGSRILEISTKCQPKETFQVGADFKTYLAARGIELGAAQAPKTKTSLSFFSTKLRREGTTVA